LVGVLDRLIVLNPNAVHEKRDRGLALFEMGETARAREDLSHYVSFAPDASDVPDIQKRIDKIQ
jgi:regulator of sirC expression with transglutaminase-like and TPR domain